MTSPQTTEHPKTWDNSSQHESNRSEVGVTDHTATPAQPNPFSPPEASAAPTNPDGDTAPDGSPAAIAVPVLAGPRAGQERHGGLRERIRYHRDLRTVEAFGITHAEVETLDGKSLHQLAGWVGIPSIWRAMFFAYVFSAEVVLLVVGIGHQAGWWGQAGWLTIAAGAFIAWAFLAQPLLIGLGVLESRWDISQDPFLTFGRSGSQAIRVLTMTRRSQLRCGAARWRSPVYASGVQKGNVWAWASTSRNASGRRRPGSARLGPSRRSPPKFTPRSSHSWSPPSTGRSTPTSSPTASGAGCPDRA